MFSERCSISHHIKAHPSKRLRASKTLKTVKSLSETKSTECDPSQGHFKRRRVLPLEHLRDYVEQKPRTKKARIDRPGSHRSDLLKIRTSFSAKGPASLRRAQSLVSQISTDRDDEAVVKVRSNDLLSKGPRILLWVRLTMGDENSFWTPQTLRQDQFFEALCTEHLSSIPLYALLLCRLQNLLTQLDTSVQRGILSSVLLQSGCPPRNRQRYHPSLSSRPPFPPVLRLFKLLSSAKKIWRKTGSRSFLRERGRGAKAMVWMFFQFRILAPAKATVGALYLTMVAGQMRARFLVLNPWRAETQVHP
jgi:hypothetical protein